MVPIIPVLERLKQEVRSQGQTWLLSEFEASQPRLGRNQQTRAKAISLSKELESERIHKLKLGLRKHEQAMKGCVNQMEK